MDAAPVSKRKKTLLAGFDSLGWEYLNFYLADGSCPNFSKLIESSTCHTLKSSNPPMTPAAWPRIYFGKEAGRLDIPGWERLDHDYCPSLITASDYRKAHLSYFWEHLFRHGLRTGVVNLPYTFPVSQECTFQLAGFDGPFHSSNLATNEICFPDNLLEAAQIIDYSPYPLNLDTINMLLRGVSLDADYERVPSTVDIELALRSWMESEEEKTTLAISLHKKYQTDFLAMYYFSCDYFAHKFPLDSWVMKRVFQHIDRCLGILLGDFDQQHDYIMLISDHGQIENTHYFYINNFLEEYKYLHYRRDIIPEENVLTLVRKLLPRTTIDDTRNIHQFLMSLSQSTRAEIVDQLRERFPGVNKAFASVDWDRTSVFYYSDYGQLYINDKVRFKHGSVVPPDRERLFKEIRKQLSDYENDMGRKLFTNFEFHDRLASEPWSYMPDITFDISDFHYYILDDPKKQMLCSDIFEQVTDLSYKVGDHTDRGILVLSSAASEKLGINREGTYRLEEIPGLIFSLYGIGINEQSEPTFFENRNPPTVPTDELKEKIRQMGYKI